MNSNTTALTLHPNAIRHHRFALARLAVLAAALCGFAFSSHGQSLDTILSTNLFEPSSVAIDSSGNDYIADSANNRITKFDVTTRNSFAFAGLGGAANFGAVDGIAQSARFFDPEGIVAVTNGFVVADTGNHLIRFVSSDGAVETLAGDIDLAQQSIDAGFPPDTYGFQDGTGAAAQFNSPTAVAWDGNDLIYIADTQNDAIRKLRLSDRSVTTVATGFSSPSGVAVGKDGRVYVSDTGNNAIKIIETNGAVTLLAGSNSRFISGYTDNANALKTQFSAPRGLFFIDSNFQLLVADSANAAIRRISDTRQAIRAVDTLVGPSAGLINPVGLSRDADGTIVIADRSANAIKAFRGAGLQLQVAAPQINLVALTNKPDCNPSKPPGTLFAVTLEVITNSIYNNDFTIAIQPENAGGIDSGVQTYYTIGATDPLKPVPDPTSSDSNPPRYFECQEGLPETILFPIRPDTTIKAVSTRVDRRPSPIVTARIRFQVANPRVVGDSASAFSLETTTTNATIWYTFGSSEDEVPDPTNAPPSNRYNNGRTINIANGTNNTYLRMRAFREGYSPSAVVKRAFIQTNTVFTTLGAPSDLEAGPGASIVVPVEVTLSAKAQIGSFQFRANVSPLAEGETPGISFVVVSATDFVLVEDPVFNPFQFPPQPILAPAQSSESFIMGPTNAVAVVYNGLLRTFPLPRIPKILVSDQIETVSYLRVDLPASARHGDRYLLSFVDVSATYDGDQQQIDIIPLPDRTITISTNLNYIVGDSALGAGYNAGQFGDRNLRNDDVNNVFEADFHRFRVPLQFTDAFNAMDAFPVDTPEQVGGDGFIRYLDWQIILRRSVQHDPVLWARHWAEGGLRMPSATNLSFALSRAESLAANTSQSTNVVWKRPALLRAGNVAGALQTNPLEVPVTLELRPGAKVSGMQFIAYVKPAGTQVPIGAISFISAIGIPAPSRTESDGADGIICAWNYDAFNPPLSGTNILGKLAFSIPATALSNEHYEISFAYPDGSLGLDTQIDFESIRGKVWVGPAASGPIERLPDEWKTFFFQSITNLLAVADFDADGDGASNYIEYLDGTNPRASDLALTRLVASGDILNFSWFASTAVQYSLEANPDLISTNWSAVLPPITGTGQIQTISYTNAAHLPSQSFRLRVNPQTSP